MIRTKHKKTIYQTVFVLMFFFCAFQAYSAVSYVRNVKPIDQEVIKIKGSSRFEGCGPVAAAMVMGFWQTERGYRLMSPADRFNGLAHPGSTIREFYKRSNTRKSPGKSTHRGKKYNQSFTMRIGMMSGLKSFVSSANKRRGTKKKLKVDIVRKIRRWKTRKKTLLNQLSKGNPVILLVKKQPPCLEYNDKWDRGRHYVVAVGYDSATKEVLLLTGWRELPHRSSSGPSVHSRRNDPSNDDAHVRCRLKEIENAKVSLIYIH
ncbi:MAG: hypothetical protein GY940_19865 [bacterium]|nr:hypothetical protein [bacterium]